MDIEPKLELGWLARANHWVRDSLVAGVVASVPLIVVGWVFDKVVLSMDGVLALMPAAWREVRWTPPWAEAAIPIFKTPGLGFALSLILLLLLGAFARGFVGKRVVRFVTDFARSIPLLGTIYEALRQLLETVFSSQAQSFQRVALVEWPRRGAYVLAFVTANAWTGASNAAGVPLVSVFIPTTPNPTSGFFTMLPENELLPLKMTVEEAFKAIMSSGIVTPSDGGLLEGADIQSMTAEMEPVRGQDA